MIASKLFLFTKHRTDVSFLLFSGIMKWFLLGPIQARIGLSIALSKFSEKDSKRFQRNFGANDNVTGGRRTDAAPEMEMKI